MKMAKIHNKLFKFTILLLCIFVTVLVTYFSKESTFLFGDDGYFSLYWSKDEGFFDCMSFSIHGGGYLGLFLSKFLCFGLPNMIGIHPADFIGIPHGIIIGIFTSIILLSITDFCNFFKKSRLLYLFVFIISIVLFFRYSDTSSIIMCYYNFYRYFFSLLFLSIFIEYIIKNLLIKQRKTNYTKLITASISGFIAGTSVEINIFSLLMFVLLIYLYSIITNPIIKNKNLSKSLKFNLDKNFYIPSISLLSAVFFVTFSKAGFQRMALERGLTHTLIDKTILTSFLQTYCKIYILDNILLILLLILLLAVGMFFAIKRNEIKKIIPPIFFTFSVFSVIFSLILLGKTNYDGNFWLTHNNIIFLYKMLMLYPLFYFISYTYRNLNKISTIKSKIVIFFLIILSVFPLYTNLKEAIKKHSFLSDEYLYACKRKSYIVEKILRFYYLKNKRPVLPKVENSNYLDSWIFLAENKADNYYVGNIITSSYYPKIYKDNKSISLGFELKDNAIKQFYKLGGIFSKEELEDIKFSRLLNNNFVLNKNYSYKEIVKLVETDVR